MHKLKKYPNRRLYDMTASRYVTMEDARALIVRGESIEVTDAKDGTDITRPVLLQILAEQEAEGHQPVLTNRAIEQIIRFYGDRMGSVVSRYIEQSIVSFLDHQEQFRTHLRALNEMNPLNLMRQAFEAPFRPRGSGQKRDSEPEPPPDLDAAGPEPADPGPDPADPGAPAWRWQAGRWPGGGWLRAGARADGAGRRERMGGSNSHAGRNIHGQ